MTRTPRSASQPPSQSYRSGATRSTNQPHKIDETMKIPPYAA
ncbi:hypothetical protein [Leptolyngbya sp. GGD]|nr:hypothetical protein [Leptolyngbya sp. GGD]